jgi:hypothetical protein
MIRRGVCGSRFEFIKKVYAFCEFSRKSRSNRTPVFAERVEKRIKKNFRDFYSVHFDVRGTV